MANEYLKDALDDSGNLSADFQKKLIPAGGTAGEVLKKGAEDPEWGTIDGSLWEADGETGIKPKSSKTVGTAYIVGLGDAASKDVGTGSSDVAAGDAPASAISTHEAAHPIPTTRDDRNAAVSHSHLIADLPVATSGTSNDTQVVRADDSRLSDARTPTSHDNTAHGTNYEAEGTAAGLISTHAGNATAHHSNANDPTADEKAALAGTGTPSASNKYVTENEVPNPDLTVVVGIEEKTDAFNLDAADAGKVIRFNSATQKDCTIRTNATHPIPTGSVYTFVQVNDGELELVGLSGVTLNAMLDESEQKMLSTAGKGAFMTIIKTDTNIWDTVGGL